MGEGLFQGFVGEDVDGDSCGDGHEEETEGPVPGYEDGAVEQGQPENADGDDLDLQGNGLVLQEVGDVWTEAWMVHEPVI